MPRKKKTSTKCNHSGGVKKVFLDHAPFQAVEWCARCGALRQGSVNRFGVFSAKEPWQLPYDLEIPRKETA